jgi:3-oxoacyl-[acyl-carrier protein] reductase
MQFNMNGHIALVCGGSKGIGKAIAVSLASEGVIPVLVSRTEQNLLFAREEIKTVTGVDSSIIVGDVGDSRFPDFAVSETMAKFGRLDILVNNAGGPAMGSFLSHGEEAWAQAVQQNLLSVIRFTKAVSPTMSSRGYGRILNVTSVLAKEPVPSMVISSTLRAGVSAFAKSVSKELIGRGVTINTICPSAVLTERARQLTLQIAKEKKIDFEDALANSVSELPIGRLADPAEIGAIATFLCSPLASYVTGTSLMVDGGSSRGIF